MLKNKTEKGKRPEHIDFKNKTGGVKKFVFDTITSGYLSRYQADRFNFFWHEKYWWKIRDVLISAGRVMLG